MIFSKRVFSGPKNCYCSRSVSLTGVTVSGQACIFTIFLLGDMDSGANEGHFQLVILGSERLRNFHTDDRIGIEFLGLLLGLFGQTCQDTGIIVEFPGPLLVPFCHHGYDFGTSFLVLRVCLGFFHFGREFGIPFGMIKGVRGANDETLVDDFGPGIVDDGVGGVHPDGILCVVRPTACHFE